MLATWGGSPSVGVDRGFGEKGTDGVGGVWTKSTRSVDGGEQVLGGTLLGIRVCNGSFPQYQPQPTLSVRLDWQLAKRTRDAGTRPTYLAHLRSCVWKPLAFPNGRGRCKVLSVWAVVVEVISPWSIPGVLLP